MSAPRLASALALAAFVAACHKAPPEDVATTAPVPVQVEAAHLGTITAYVRVTGLIEPAPGADWTVTAPDKARVTEIRFAPGDYVRQGMVVARFDAPPLRADLATRSSEQSQARARLENARKNYDRLATLLEKGIASRKEVEDARKELLDAESAVSESGQTHAAAVDLAARATPIAPFSGVVAERWHNPGDIIDANEHVLRVVDLRRLQVTAAVPVADATRVVVGHAARVTVPGGQGREIEGKVVGTAATVDPVTGSAAIRVAVSGSLPVGTPVEISIVAEQRPNALIVPAAAIVREENKTTVFAVGADNKAHRRAVVVGIVSAEEAQIVSGLREGEKVVVKGQDELPDGATVTIEEAEEPEPAGKEEPAAKEETAGEAPTAGDAASRPDSGGDGAAPPVGTAGAATPPGKGREHHAAFPSRDGADEGAGWIATARGGAASLRAPMNPARVSSRHARAVLLVTALLAAAGFISLMSLPSDIYPPLNFPRVVIIGHTGTLPARSMALSVTRPIEQVVMEVPGIRRVRSETFRGSTEISAQFDPSADILQALQQVQNRVSELRGELPAETELTVERLTTSAFPILSYNITGGLPEADLRDYAFYVVRPTVARVPGVGRVEVGSSDTREIQVVTQPPRLLASGLTVHDVAEALKASNQVTPVARYPSGGLQYLVLASGLWSSVAEIGQTPVSVKGGAVVRVADLGDVFPGAPDRVTLVTGNGKPAAIVSVSQQVGSNILDVRDGVETALRDLTSSLPSGLHVSKVYDLAGFVADAMASVRDAILIGGVLAIVVLFVFLRSWRITLVAALTLPLTVISTFLFMRFFGETVNLMSMGGLAVAIGLVIDDAVVVVENIHRHLAHGEENAIEKATAELVAPVVGSTLTTVVVFAPLGLLSGVVGQFFRALSITLSVSVIISLFLALSLIPLLSHWAYGKGAHAEETSRKLDDRYTATLEKAMARPRLLLVGVGVLILFAVLVYTRVGSGFLPHMDEGGFVIDYLSPPGSALEETDRMIRKVEKIVADTPEVASFSRRTGAELGLFATQPNKGDVLVRLKPRGQRKRSADAVIEEMRPKIGDEVPGLEIEFVQLLQDMIGDLEGQPNPIEVKIFGDDAERLAALAEQIQPKVEKIDGIVDVVGVERGTPEVTWTIDPVASGRLGLTVEQVSQQLQGAWLGEVATELRLLDRTIPVRVRYPDAIRLDPNRLAQTTVRGADGKVATISSLAHSTASGAEPIMKRENLRQMATVTARLEGRDLGSAVKEIKGILAGVKLPVGYTVEVGGQFESQRQAFRELLLVLGIAASLVLVVLVIEFRSFTPAILILAAAPLSFGGALLMLLITGTELNVSSAMGFILLIGLVVKNGIVMIDYAHHLHEGGLPFQDAVERAARIRLRPILMTTLCTLFGLLPLALGLGAGAELQKPLALVVIGGLSLSTLVTLFAVPTFYVGLRRRSEDKKPPAPATVAPAPAV